MRTSCYNDRIFSGGDGGQGPLRCGIFAKSGTTREQAGASYYGIMELSGNLWERCVTVADQDETGTTTNAGTFDGSHGDGALSTNGHATNSTWPGYSGGEVTGALGAGCRGGLWSGNPSSGRVSDRTNAGYADPNRYYFWGVRGVRSAP